MNKQYVVSYEENLRNEKYSKPVKITKGAKSFLTIVGVMSVIFVLSTVYIWQLTQITKHKTEIAKAERERKVLTQNIQNLDILIAKLSSFERIKTIAEEELDMIKSTDIKYIEVPVSNE